MTPEELAGFDGSDPSKPLYLAVRGTVFDVSAGASFYGPGGSYHVFAGKECARALGLMLIELAQCNGDVSDLTEAQMQTLMDWEARFRKKYAIIGQLPRQGAPTTGLAASESQDASAKVHHHGGAQAGRHVATSHHSWVSAAVVALLLAVLVAGLLQVAY